MSYHSLGVRYLQRRYLYLMISQTDTQIGRMIRAISGFPYNHVSMSLDPTFHRWVSFGRYNRRAPLYAGYITESPERYLAKGRDIRVRIFRMELSQERYAQLSNLFSHAGDRDCGLVYNTFDMVAAAFRRQVEIPGAYTCLGFACAVLGMQCINIPELNRELEPMLIFDGSLARLVPDSGSRTDHYFDQYGLIQGAWSSVVQFAVLIWRFFGDCAVDLTQFYCR